MKPKAALRKRMIARRDALDALERRRLAEALTASLVSLPEYESARAVLATMSIGSELSTRGFLDRARADGKAVVLPRIAGPGRLDLHVVEDLEADLVPGVWDIPEPDPSRCAATSLADVDFAWVPALAVDPEGFRLGYGAGFFDRLLADPATRPYCVAALPAGFVVEDVHREPHDVAVHRVVAAP